MGTMKDELERTGLAAKPKSAPPKGKGNYQSEEDRHRQRVIQAFGPNYQQFLLTNGGADYNAYVDRVKSYVEKNKQNFTSSQLRNIFSKVKSLREAKEAWKLRPNLAYAAGRSDKPGTKEIVWLLDDLIRTIGPDDKDKLENFKNFFEAVIAYHKYYGGK